MSRFQRPSAPPENRSGRSERRIVSIMFCDVTNSTRLAENIDPEEWVEIMNEAFEKMTAPVLRYEGTVGKFTGDGLLAFFGAPVSHEDDPNRAVLAGLEILESMTDLQESVRRDYGEEFNLRIGVNTGLAVVGEVGSKSFTEYTVMGDAVNIAARIEQTAQPGTLQISSETQKLINGSFELDHLGGIEVKGKSDPVDVFRVLGTNFQYGGSRSVAAPLIGRDKEIRDLVELLLLTKDGSGQVVSIIGEAGLGKSRLLNELREKWVRSESQLSWELAQGIPYDIDRPYSMFQNLARGMFGVELSDPPDVIHRKVDDVLRSMGGTDEAVSLCSVAVERVIASKVLHEALDHSAEAIKNDIFQVVIPAFIAASQDAPRAVIFDDLQWADDASKELIIHMARAVTNSRMIIILAFRPDQETPAWEVRDAVRRSVPERYTEIELTPLNVDDTNRLISELLHIQDIPVEARNLVLRKSEGNPYFVEEVVRWFEEQGIVRKTPTGFVWDKTSEITDDMIPDSIQSLLMARMDRLSNSARDTLQLASVIGRAFYHRVLGQISDSSIELDAQLATLETQEMIHEQSVQPELQYVFKHELARDAAYSSILLRRRRELHLKVADAMETLFADDLETNAHRLGYHFSVANDHERAMKYFEMASDVATGINARSEAAKHLRNAITAAAKMNTPEPKVSTLTDRLAELVAPSG